MIIELPPMYDMSEITAEDLFVPDEDDLDDFGVPRGRKFSEPMEIDSGGLSGLSDAEIFQYTSSSNSESDFDMVDSNIESIMYGDSNMDMQSAPQIQRKVRSRSIMQVGDREIALNSPGSLLNTPRDSSRRYEYPFPTHDVSYFSSLEDSPVSTPSLSPQFEDVSSTSASTTTRSARSPTPPKPAPVLGPAGPSQSLVRSQTPTTHPKLSKFSPADAPVPPSLRGRTIIVDKSESGERRYLSSTPSPPDSSPPTTTPSTPTPTTPRITDNGISQSQIDSILASIAI